MEKDFIAKLNEIEIKIEKNLNEIRTYRPSQVPVGVSNIDSLAKVGLEQVENDDAVTVSMTSSNEESGQLLDDSVIISDDEELIIMRRS